MSLLLAFLALLAGDPAPDAPEVPLRFAVATVDGKPVVDEAWIDAQVARANQLYAAVPLRFRRVALSPLAARFARLVTRADRDAAGRGLTRGAIDIRITGELLDVDEPGRPRRGVHWRVRRAPTRHFIILSAIAGSDVLAHELGHYFGNPHSFVDDNLMSYRRGGGSVFLDALQLGRIREALRRYLGRRELVPLAPEGMAADRAR